MTGAIRVLKDAHAIIRRRPGMFFADDATTDALAQLVMRDVRDAGGVPILFRTGDFTAVSSDKDWLAAAPFPGRELFARIAPPIALRPNEHRAEVLIGATCIGWLTAGNGEIVAHNLALDDLPADIQAAIAAAKRVVAWRFERDHWEALKTAAMSGAGS